MRIYYASCPHGLRIQQLADIKINSPKKEQLYSLNALRNPSTIFFLRSNIFRVYNLPALNVFIGTVMGYRFPYTNGYIKCSNVSYAISVSKV